MKRWMFFLLVLLSGRVAMSQGFYVFKNGNVVYECEVGEVDSISFISPYSVAGRLNGKFSVSTEKKISFSKGNLQYNPVANLWRFAETQYDYIGDNNALAAVDYNGWMDLFGYGTSGWNSGATAYMPYSTSSNYSDYYSSNIDARNTDWGVFNSITNGGGTIGLWRTMTRNEWLYLFQERENATGLWGLAIVNDINGLILLPDGCELPSTVTFTSGSANGFETNSYSIEEFSIIERFGVVFLPAAGFRQGTTMRQVGEQGRYWTATFESAGNSYALYILSSGVNHSYYDRSRGSSVRLVMDR